MPLHAPEPDNNQHDCTQCHVHSVKTCEYKKRRAVNAGRQLQVHVAGVGVNVFFCLQADEQKTKQKRCREENRQHGAIAAFQRIMRNGNGDATRQQDQRVDRRQTPGPHR